MAGRLLYKRGGAGGEGTNVAPDRVLGGPRRVPCRIYHDPCWAVFFVLFSVSFFHGFLDDFLMFFGCIFTLVFL